MSKNKCALNGVLNSYNPVHNTGKTLSLEEAILKFGEDYNICGSSPNMFCDCSWYKDIWYDNRKDCLKQFRKKRASLLLAGMPEIILHPEEMDQLSAIIAEITLLEVQYEKTFRKEYIVQIVDKLLGLTDIFNKIPKVYDIYCEIIAALNCVLNDIDTFDFKNYKNFFAAFGRSQQYIAFEKE